MAASLIGVLFNLFYILIHGLPLNDNYDNSYGDSHPGRNKERATSPTCGTPDPLNSPSIPTPKLNLPITPPLTDAVNDEEVSTLV